jgi:hypothetical protein
MASFVLSKAKPRQQPRPINVSAGYVQQAYGGFVSLTGLETVFTNMIPGVAARRLSAAPGVNAS